jgi:hypothetical protein
MFIWANEQVKVTIPKQAIKYLSEHPTNPLISVFTIQCRFDTQNMIPVIKLGEIFESRLMLALDL